MSSLLLAAEFAETGAPAVKHLLQPAVAVHPVLA